MAVKKKNQLFIFIHNYFITYLPDIKKYSPHTVRAYQTALEMFLDYAKDQKGIPLREVTMEMLDSELLAAFLDFIEKEKGCGVSTRNHRLHCIRAFFSYAANEDLNAVAFWEDIKKVKASKTAKKLVGHMSGDAVEAIISQPDTRTEKGLRDMFLLLFLYQTAARVQELADCRLCDIRWGSAASVILHGKGEKNRIVPLRENTVEHLRSYIERFHGDEQPLSRQYLFYVIRGGRKKRMTEDNVRRLVHQYAASARDVCPEVPENVHPHLFRHSRAMHLYQNGVDLTLLSQWLGHSQLETTLIYAHADTEMKRRAIEKAVPEEAPLKQLLNAERMKVTDDDLLKRLCGLK